MSLHGRVEYSISLWPPFYDVNNVPHPSMNVAFLGPLGTFSHEYVLQRFGEVNLLPLEGFDGFDQIVAAVTSDRADAAVLPFINTYCGGVRPVQKLLARYRDIITVSGFSPLAVHHHLVVSEDCQDLKTVYSKEQVFPQISNWVNAHPDLSFTSAPSTAGALQDILQGVVPAETSGAVCNRLAIDLLGGKILEEGIHNLGNSTAFLTIEKRKSEHCPAEERALVCVTCPTEECYQNTVTDFGERGYPILAETMKGEFSSEMPAFIEFKGPFRGRDLEALLDHEFRRCMGTYASKDALSTCVLALFGPDFQLQDEV